MDYITITDNQIHTSNFFKAMIKYINIITNPLDLIKLSNYIDYILNEYIPQFTKLYKLHVKFPERKKDIYIKLDKRLCELNRQHFIYD